MTTRDYSTDTTAEKVYYHHRPRCPECDSAALRTIRSLRDEEDGSSRQRRECRSCGYRFWLVLE